MSVAGRLALDRRAWLAVTLPGLAGLLGRPRSAGATHRPDHRFVVLGFLHDEGGGPLASESVVVTRLKTGLRHDTRTEADGFYLVVVHLHDEDEGERLRVAARGTQVEVVARFVPGNHRLERGTRLDLRGRLWREERSTFAETLRAYLAR